MLKLINLIASIECAIGASTALSLFYYPGQSGSRKPTGVFIFVLIAAAVSFLIGAGLFLKKEKARKYLVYFSGYIVIEKMLVFLGVLSLNGRVLVAVLGIPVDGISVVYHLLILWLFNKPNMKLFFGGMAH